MLRFQDLSTSVLGVAAVGLLAAVGGCKSGVQADATVEPGMAEAHVQGESQSESEPAAEPETGEAMAAHTGILIHGDIVEACGIDGANTYFAFDSAKIDGEGHDVLAGLATCVTSGALAGRTLMVVGHADPRGGAAYNKELGLERAESVAKCLRDHGVALPGVEIASLGEAEASDNPSEWPEDRRVEVELKPAESAQR